MSKNYAYMIQWNKNEMGKTYLLDAATTVVGRSSSADLVLADTSVSRHHALISQHTTHYDLEDMVSSNGTFINTDKIEGRAILHHGDIIGFGSVLFKFFTGKGPEPQPWSQGENTDTLTGLPNKTAILNCLNEEKTFFETYGRCFSVIYLDFDGIKQICEARGLDAGDKVLMEGARRIRDLIGDYDIVGRMESDQFVLILPNASCVAAMVLAEHIVDRFAGSPFEIPSGSGLLAIDQTVSAGVAQFSEKLTGIESLLELARERMLHCKINGGNQAAS